MLLIVKFIGKTKYLPITWHIAYLNSIGNNFTGKRKSWWLEKTRQLTVISLPIASVHRISGLLPYLLRLSPNCRKILQKQYPYVKILIYFTKPIKRSQWWELFCRNLPDFPKFLGIAMETFLLMCDDKESDVRMAADECLNRTIKVIVKWFRFWSRFYRKCRWEISENWLDRFGDIIHL